MAILQIISESFHFEQEKAITKKELRQAMSLSPRTFTNRLAALEPEIIGLYPKYNKRCSILNPKIARFIVEELGFNIEAIRNNLKNQLVKNK